MTKTLSLYFILALLLTSCITVSVQTGTPPAPHFVTSTLPPTKMVTPRPTSTGLPALTTDIAIMKEFRPCANGAVLLEDVTVPDNSSVPAGQTFTKTWKFKNTGSCPWAGFTINYASGERMNAPASVPVPETAAGETVELSVDLTAPLDNGTFTTHFSLQNPTGEAIVIGAENTFYAKVIVGAGGVSAEDASAAVQSPSISPGMPAVSIGYINIYCKYNYSENAAYVQELAFLINQARGNAGLSALNPSALLTQAAQAHSIDMACNNFLGHDGSDGSRFGALVHTVGYPGSFQEIIAIGTPQNAMDQWYADPGHWEIVLNALATEMGIGYAYNANSNFGGYFTVDIH
jgi:uncharacterized protein YkwD